MRAFGAHMLVEVGAAVIALEAMRRLIELDLAFAAVVIDVASGDPCPR